MKHIHVPIPYGDEEMEFVIPERNLLAIGCPHPVAPVSNESAEVQRSLDEPIGAMRLKDAVRGCETVVILADDMTRMTPVELILPILLDELNAGGIRDEQVTVLIALGTHRPMTVEEITRHFGEQVQTRVQIINHPWRDSGQMVDLGLTPNGTPVSVSRIALDADFLIGVGSIVPHHIPGFSGGAKIVQPGISGAETTGATHYLSTRALEPYLGCIENPVRKEMEQIASQVGLKGILNVVLDAQGRLIRSFYGDPVIAHRAGAVVSREVYGIALPAKADIVIAGSHPCDIEFWQAHKSLYSAQLAVKPGGSIIIVTPCPEGVSVVHQDILSITGLTAGQIDEQIQRGMIDDVVSGALALAWARVREYAPVSLVSGGINRDETRGLGFTYAVCLQDALDTAMMKHSTDSLVTVLPYAPDSLPLVMHR